MSITVAQQGVLLKRYGFDDSDPIQDWLNASMHDIEIYEDWYFLEVLTTVVTVAGNPTVALPTDAAKVISIRDMTNKQKLQPMQRTQFEREVFDPTVQGMARIYVTTGMSTLQFYPVPDSVDSFQAVYQGALTDVVIGVSTPPPLPAPFHYPMVLHAAYIALMAENEEERATAAQKQYDSMMNNLSKKYGSRNLDEPETVTDAMNYADESYGVWAT